MAEQEFSFSTKYMLELLIPIRAEVPMQVSKNLKDDLEIGVHFATSSKMIKTLEMRANFVQKVKIGRFLRIFYEQMNKLVKFPNEL